jgi:NAD-dependent dihydropyrimidine dehydrogenase PreA subunit
MANDASPPGITRSPRFDAAKSRQAAMDPERPGERCRAEPATYELRIDRHRCEGKGDCEAVCPYGVFEVGRLSDEAFAALSFLGKLKSRAHGRRTAYTPRADACRACGQCVVACPEQAITLVRRTPETPAR